MLFFGFIFIVNLFVYSPFFGTTPCYKDMIVADGLVGSASYLIGFDKA